MFDDRAHLDSEEDKVCHAPAPTNVLTFDVEDWSHILPAEEQGVPPQRQWDSMECRVDRNMNIILATLAETSVSATFFWLGWVAKRHKHLVRKCLNMGHEVACHGYAHGIPCEVTPEVFDEDALRGKATVEDITGQRATGFRAPGFGVSKDTMWVFDHIRRAGFVYDASSFPAKRATGDMAESPLDPHVIDTPAGPLWECPVSVVSLLGRRVSLFSGGYLRAAPLSLIRWGLRKLERQGRPAVVLIHPREVDPGQPRLPLRTKRRIECYLNLKDTIPKLRWLCANLSWSTMSELVEGHKERKNYHRTSIDGE